MRSWKEAFDEIPEIKIEGEMLELAKHIINMKKGSFDAKTFDDRYDTSVAELVKAKIEGRALPKKKAPAPSKQSDLLQALRESAGTMSTQKPRATPKPAAPAKQPKRAGGSKRAA